MSSSLQLFQLRGVKPWQGGCYITSSGLRDLDIILGGGQVLGTSIVLEEDRFGSRELATTLVKYWCAEAVSHKQHLLIPVISDMKCVDDKIALEDNVSLSSLLFDYDSSLALKGDASCFAAEDVDHVVRELILSLPRNLHWDTKRKNKETLHREQEKYKVTAQENNEFDYNTEDLAAIAIEEEENGEERETPKKVYDSSDDILQNAWQYKKSVQLERLGSPAQKANTVRRGSTDKRKLPGTISDVFCHSYDLSGRMIDQVPLNIDSYTRHLPTSSSMPQSQCRVHAKGFRLFTEIARLLKKLQLSDPHDSQKVIRLLLYHPPMETIAIALPLLISHIRTGTLPVVIMICKLPSDDLISSIRLARACDVVLSTEGFAERKEFLSPPEFRHLQGVLKVPKTTRKRTEIAASVFGLKRDRRKLHIPLLHISSEDCAGDCGSVGAGRRAQLSLDCETKLPSTGGTGSSRNGSGSML